MQNGDSEAMGTIRTNLLREELLHYGGDMARMLAAFDALETTRPRYARHTTAFRLYFGLGTRPRFLKEVGHELGVGPGRARDMWRKAARLARKESMERKERQER